jgi:hypothetical protein
MLNVMLFAAVLCLAGLAAYYVFGVRTGPMQSESRSVERDASKTLRVTVRMGAGTLKVRGGSKNWMGGDFEYNVPDWKPTIRYATSGGEGDLTIEQSSRRFMGIGPFGKTTNEWDLRLNDKIPTNLTVTVGAGEARLDLGTLSLRSLEIEMGAGELQLDLRGNPSRSYDVHIRGGAGEATVKLPRDVGVHVKAVSGVGEIKVRGLHSEGDDWVNDAYAKSKVQVRLDVQGGVGAINLIAE